ncbi:hypothetical protein [Angustibacter luteus]|uniref:Fibronectin type-III domain-containing protein n=1 Tax=Angustibacter luteus TaxID=658456 RepID=A0ABW1JCV3_9ACTN
MSAGRLVAVVLSALLGGTLLASPAQASDAPATDDPAQRVVRIWSGPASGSSGQLVAQVTTTGVGPWEWAPSLNRLALGSSDPVAVIGPIPGTGVHDVVDTNTTPGPGQVAFWPNLPYTASCSGDYPMTGKVDVSQVAYDDNGLLRSLTAAFRWRCSTRLDEQVMVVQVSPAGVDRAPAPWLRLTPPSPGARAVLGTPHVVTWTLSNDGTAPAHVLAASVDRSGTAVDADSCVGELAPGASCAIETTTPYADDAWTGQERAELRVRSTDPGTAPGAGPDGQDDAQLPDVAASATWQVVAKETGVEIVDGFAVPGLAQVDWQGIDGAPVETGAGLPRDILVERLDGDSWVPAGVAPFSTPTLVRGLPERGTVTLRLIPRTTVAELPATDSVRLAVAPEGILSGDEVRPIEDAPLLGTSELVDAPGVAVAAVEQTPDGHHLVVAGTRADHRAVLGTTNASGQEWHELATTADVLRQLRVSPDSTFAVASDGRHEAVRIDLSSGQVTPLPTCCTPAGFSPDGRSVLMFASTFTLTGLSWLDLASGTWGQTLPGTAGVTSADVSRDGSIAYVVGDQTPASVVRVIRPGSTTSAAFWAMAGIHSPRWDRTGTRMVARQYGASGSVVREADGTLRTVHAALGAAPSWLEPSSSRAPGVSLPTPGATTTSPGWTASTTSIPFVVNDPDDRAGSVTSRCSLDGAPATACRSPLALQHLAAGAHTLRVTATDPAGNTSTAAATWRVEVTAPTAALSALPTVTMGSVRVGWTGQDTGGSGLWSYDARYREWQAEGLAGSPVYVQPSRWQGLRTPSLVTATAAGTTRCVSVRARDRAGNVGPWSAERCVMTPLDDRGLNSYGFSRAVQSGAFRSTLSVARSPGRSLSRPEIHGSRIALVVTTCPTCGSVEVGFGPYTRRVSLYSKKVAHRVVLWLPAHTSGTRSVLITSTSSRYVAIDGIVVRR